MLFDEVVPTCEQGMQELAGLDEASAKRKVAEWLDGFAVRCEEIADHVESFLPDTAKDFRKLAVARREEARALRLVALQMEAEQHGAMAH